MRSLSIRPHDHQRSSRTLVSWLLATSAVLMLVVGCAGGGPEESQESAEDSSDAASVFASLSPGWNTFEPGEGTTCSDGSAFRFFARAGDPKKLLVYFQGGGGCWTAATCDRENNPTYTTTAPNELIEAVAGEPRPEGAMNGIFDYTREDNPLADYSAVFVPYCTGDVHLGNTLASYEVPATDDSEARNVTVEHKGIVNANAALEWTFSAFDAPEEIFVTGSSAGSIPSPFYAHLVKKQYPSARVTQLGDGSGGYRRMAQTSLPHTQWGTLAELAQHLSDFAGMSDEDFNYEKLYIAAAKANPDIMFSQYDSAEDDVQKRFLAISGADSSNLQPLLDANRADIRAEVENFRAFTVGGDSHTILGREAFYTYRVGDVTFRDWVASLLAGEEVDDVHCGDDCAEVEAST